ncbi:fizzy-related protein homolog [Hydractinia symbiolongicarpus]|uniref:fizzy-related protein homolog n=1 Tax=Hydractinia symbiolongicarpus TaxID=13093 RepID=UPI00254DF5BF|nr:fizzy-related protein homolog [Hydractinia symbiolongicarpus]
MDPDYEQRLFRQVNGQRTPTKNSPASSPYGKGSPILLSPSKRKPEGDRFIPSRAIVNLSRGFLSTPPQENSEPSQTANTKEQTPSTENKESLLYTSLLRNELLRDDIESLSENCDERHPLSTPKHVRSLFKNRTPKRKYSSESLDAVSPYSVSPIGSNSHKLLRSPKKAIRKISKVPFKVLDAPDLQDDFYLNLVDWSSQNILSVGLGSCVYLWSAYTSQVTKLCDLSSENDPVTSVAWTERGNHLAVGTHKGFVQIWDVSANKRVSVLQGHTTRVGSLAWNNDLLCSGSRDRIIFMRDVRCPTQSEKRLVGHKQEVCGLKWSPDKQLLASGGNDNRLLVWNLSNTTPYQQYADHTAAVKAIAWSPHQHGLLASGGGTVDKTIRFWNTLTGQPMQCVDTGSQVCNLAWSKHSNELVSTHGYSQNQVLVWKYPSLTQVAKLTGHTYRVLYLSMSPDGESVVTGAGDETLRFWNVFSKTNTQKESRSELNLFSHIR